MRMGVPFSKAAVLAAVLALAVLLTLPAYAQITGSISGTVLDQSGAVVPKAKVSLINQANQDTRLVESNQVGYFTFAGVVQGTYTIKVEAQNFKTWQRVDFVMNAGDTRAVPDIALQVGQISEKVVVEEAQGAINVVESGEKASVITSQQIETLGLIGRDAAELLKTLPGVSVPSNGMNNSSEFNYSDVGAARSSPIGHGMAVMGAPYRGGVSTLYDGAFVTDPGDNSSNMAATNQSFTAEVKVQTSNFGVDSPRGPVVVNTTSKYGTTAIHGQAQFFARNSALNANDWTNNHNHAAKPDAKYYYPDGSIGGPVAIPGTNLGKKLFFWGGFQYIWQLAPGVIPSLTSWIPSASMRAGNFDMTLPDNAALCPSGATTGDNTWCRSLAGGNDQNGNPITGTSVTVDPGAAAMMSFWPTANATNSNYNYFQPIIPQHNGWVYRTRVDYNLSDNDKIYGSWQQGKDSTFAWGDAHMWWVPGNSIPFPGDLFAVQETKTLTGTFLHVFNSTLTNEFIGSWAWANMPQVPGDITQATRGGTGYPSAYGMVYRTPSGSDLIPGYNSGGRMTFPDFSQDDGFTTTGNVYFLKKASVSFADHLTKVSRSHTIKIGGNYDMLGNNQANLSSYQGRFSFGAMSPRPDAANPAISIGTQNPLANFLMGIASGYNETNKATVNDQAFKTYGFYGMDTFKLLPRVTVNYGVRVDHYGRWYDRHDLGAAVFLPNRVEADSMAGKAFPGVYWHAMDPGVPLGGSPVRALFVSPRFGMSWDLFGNGKTVLRGGWGKYRWQDQWNDYGNPLSIPLGQSAYNLPGGTAVRTRELSSLVPSVGWSAASVNAANATDMEIPVTTSFNFTISQQMPWHSLLEVAYVGNKTEHLLLGGQVGGTNIGGTNSLTNLNKVPLGAFYGPDPVLSGKNGHGNVYAYSPEGIPGSVPAGHDPTLTPLTWHYYPRGIAWMWTTDPVSGLPVAKQIYGTNAINITRHDGYANYNGLQMAWTKQSEHVSFNLNYTWSKSMGILNNAVNAFDVHANYGPLNIDRSHVVNASYSYAFGKVVKDNKVLAAVANDWTISGITSIQSGANLMEAYNSQNLGTQIQWTRLATDPAMPINPDTGLAVGSGLGSSTYWGTNAPMAVFPTLTCDPKGTGSSYINISCLTMATPGLGNSGSQKLPYIHGPAYFTSDLSFYKGFKITERQSLRFQVSAFNFLNHPLSGFSGNNNLTPKFDCNYFSHVCSLRSSTANPFAVSDNKNGARLIELGIKYSF